jgi:hypothetical protein
MKTSNLTNPIQLLPPWQKLGRNKNTHIETDMIIPSVSPTKNDDTICPRYTAGALTDWRGLQQNQCDAGRLNLGALWLLERLTKIKIVWNSAFNKCIYITWSLTGILMISVSQEPRARIVYSRVQYYVIYVEQRPNVCCSFVERMRDKIMT